MESQVTPALTPEIVPVVAAAEGKRDPRARFARFARTLLGYTLGVILFGAGVRITDSGAGCGQHWPTCNGEVLHLPKSLHTLIELTHRLTSGLSLLAVLGLLIGAFRLYPRGHARARFGRVQLRDDPDRGADRHADRAHALGRS